MNYTPEQISEIVIKVDTLSSEERKKLARNPNTSVEYLKVLATDKNYLIRWGVAYNPNTPVEILKVLATDRDSAVRCTVANNPNTPLEAPTLKELALEELKCCEMHHTIELKIIRQALEALPNDN